jgi:hypothetical protein
LLVGRCEWRSRCVLSFHPSGGKSVRDMIASILVWS